MADDMAIPQKKQQKLPSAEETLRHPAYPGTIWGLEPHSNGKLAVAKDRGGPVNIVWEIHGAGPIKVVLLMGLVGVKTAWQRQTKYFGHEKGDEYSVMILDNRGIGASDKPLARYTTSDMAKDAIEVLDHVGWTEERSINVVGISMGGMIAQEMAMAAPQRLQSMSLCCTSGAVESNKGLAASISDTLGFLIPKSMERTIADTGRQLFTPEWLAAPDAEVLPVPGTTPRCAPPPPPAAGSGSEAGSTSEYLLFDCNFQRFQAQELTKRRAPGEYTTRGLLCQLGAAAGHKKTDEQLRAIADAVGRDRILVMHGTRDELITVNNGERLIRVLQPGKGLIEEGMGHAPPMERFAWFNDVLEERFRFWSKLQ